MFNQDTIYAPATPVGSGAVSVIRISGPSSLEFTDKLVSFRKGKAVESKGYEIKFGEIPGLDEVLVSLYRAPHSYTGEDAAEISCHASAYVVGAILQRLGELGCRMADPGEFTRRAYLNGKMDLAQAEAVADLIAADSQAAHKLAFSQLKGGYSEEFRQLRAQLVELASLVELELDFSEEEVEFADRSRISELLDKARVKVDGLKASYNVGNAVKSGVPVAIVGAPNSGKSTLLNALLGEDRAIVSDIPGTTRDTVEETMVLEGVRYRFIDTAGLRESSDTIEQLGIGRSLEKLRSASIVICVLDACDSPSERSAVARQVLAEVSRDQKVIFALNKCDLMGSSPEPVCDSGDFTHQAPIFEPSVCDSGGFAHQVVAISALRGTGLDALRSAIASCGFGLSGSEGAVVTSARHYQALCEASEDLSRASSALASNLPGDLLAEDLRSAISTLGSIFGEITSDELLGEIFSKFCIGK